MRDIGKRLAGRGSIHAPELVDYGNFRSRMPIMPAAACSATAPRPTALFVANNLMLIGVMRALADEGVSVPRRHVRLQHRRFPLGARLPARTDRGPAADRRNGVGRLPMSRRSAWWRHCKASSPDIRATAPGAPVLRPIPIQGPRCNGRHRHLGLTGGCASRAPRRRRDAALPGEHACRGWPQLIGSARRSPSRMRLFGSCSTSRMYAEN